MIKTTLNWTIKNLKNMYDEKATLSFDHPIQRQSSQWSNIQQSLLVHSILANFPVPAIYVEKNDSDEIFEKGKPVFKYSVLDGKQRMTTLFSFINGDYALNENTPDVEIEGTRYHIAEKTFDELDEDVKQELLRFKFQIFAFEECDDDMIEEIFFRLNNSTPLTKPQKSKPLMGTSNAKFIDDILKDTFFREKCNFSQLQLRKSDDMCTLLQAMMLLDNKYYQYEYSSISADEVMRYSKSIKDNYTDTQKALLKSCIDYLNEAFDSKERHLKKINIPMAILLSDEAIVKDVKPNDFRNWFLYFFVACKSEYGQYCSSGSIKKEKVLGRLEIMTNHFEEHFHLNTVGNVKGNATNHDNADIQEETITPVDNSFDEQVDEIIDTEKNDSVESALVEENDDSSDEAVVDMADEESLELGSVDYNEESKTEMLLVSE